MPVRTLTHRSEAAATLAANVEVVTGDLTVPESLDAGLRGVGAVLLVWTAPPTTAPAVVERLATYAQRVVFLSSPHQTPHPFFQQPNPMAVLHADIERLIARYYRCDSLDEIARVGRNDWEAGVHHPYGVRPPPCSASQDIAPQLATGNRIHLLLRAAGDLGGRAADA